MSIMCLMLRVESCCGIFSVVVVIIVVCLCILLMDGSILLCLLGGVCGWKGFCLVCLVWDREVGCLFLCCWSDGYFVICCVYEGVVDCLLLIIV